MSGKNLARCVASSMDESKGPGVPIRVQPMPLAEEAQPRWANFYNTLFDVVNYLVDTSVGAALGCG